MNMRILGLSALLALVLAGTWMWLGWGESAGGDARVPQPVVADRAEPPAPELEQHEALDAVRVPVEPDVGAPAASGSVIVDVLVIDKETRLPMAGVEVLPHTEAGGRYEPDKGLSRGKPWDTLRTDESGRVVIETPPLEKLWITAYGERTRAGSASTELQPLGAGSQTAVVLEIPTADDAPFWLKLVDEETNAPIADARIDTARGTGASIRTDGRGLAHYLGRSWAPVELRIEAPGRTETYVGPGAGHERVGEALVVALPQRAELRVRVVDGAGLPVPDAAIDLSTPEYNLTHPRSSVTKLWGSRMGDRHWRAKTDSTGTATFSPLPPRQALSASITIPRPWTCPDKLVLEPGETREVEWNLSSGCEVRGSVLDQVGAPVIRHEMWLCKAPHSVSAYLHSSSRDEALVAMTDDQGRFRFSGVGPGSWLVGPSPPKRDAKIGEADVSPIGRLIEIVEGQGDLDLTLMVSRGLTIRGLLLDSKGEPAKFGSVNAHDEASKLSAFGNLTRGTHAFEIGPLMPGRYVLRARALGGSPDADAPSEPVEVEAGAQVVVLRLRPGAALSGHVRDPDGAPLAAKLWITKREATSFGVRGMNCREDGVFSIGGLDAGRYDISASTSDGLVGVLEAIEMKPGEPRSDLVIRLQPGGHVRVRHEGPDQYASIRVFQRDVLVSTDGVERGTTREFACPAGTVTVRAEYHGENKRTMDRAIEVNPGETVDVVFEKDTR